MSLRYPTAVLHPSIGAELWIDFTLGHFSQADLRLGLARGLDRFAPGLEAYFVAASGF